MILRQTTPMGILSCIKRIFYPLNYSQPLSNIIRFRNQTTIAMPKSRPHIPVMLSEVISYLSPAPGDTIVDMTFGGGGHTESILQSTPGVKVIAVDRDPLAHHYAQKLSETYPNQVWPVLGRFSEVLEHLKALNIAQVDGILFDLGCSSMMFDDPSRGFSVSHDGPLDMRMDGKRFPDQPTAADVLQYIKEEDLAKILKVYGEEKQAKKLARAIIEARYLFKSLRTTSELASLIASVLDDEVRLDKLSRPAHVATKAFQALRIFVNNEMNELNRGLEIAQEVLKPGGNLVVLTFHSLEDRIVKRHMTGVDLDEPVTKTLSQKFRNPAKVHTEAELAEIFSKKWNVVTKHVQPPSSAEVEENPRSRSAKLRCATKVNSVMTKSVKNETSCAAALN